MFSNFKIFSKNIVSVLVVSVLFCIYLVVLYGLQNVGSAQTSGSTISSSNSEVVLDDTAPVINNPAPTTVNLVLPTNNPTPTPSNNIIIREVTPVPTPTNNRNPLYTFNTNTAGTVNFIEGACNTVGQVSTRVAGDVTIVIGDENGSPLPYGTYDNCVLTLTGFGEGFPFSNPLKLSTFVISDDMDNQLADGTDDKDTKHIFLWVLIVFLVGFIVYLVARRKN